MDKKIVLKLLKSKDCKITFIKKNGDERTINAKLDNKAQPLQFSDKPLIAVIDKELNKFRTVNTSTIRDIK